MSNSTELVKQESVKESEADSNNTVAPGTAKLKAQFIIQDHVRKLNMTFVAARDKKKVRDADDADSSAEPPKKKLKGQNKHRPRGNRVPKSEKLCFKIGVGDPCPFGDRCCYSHDVVSYLAKKQPDIGEKCYLYETFGLCPYSFACRFASSHLIDSKNIENKDLLDKHKNVTPFKNQLTKELQISLRHRKYDFSKSNKVLEKFQSLNVNSQNVPENKLNKNVEVSEGSLKQTENSESLNGASNEVKRNCDDTEIKTDTLKTVNGNHSSENDVKIVNFESDIEINNASKELNTLSQDSSKEKPISVQGDEKFTNPVGTIVDDVKFNHLSVPKKVNFRDKLYLAPLTTVGNLPFRRVCKEFGADITCSEMALSLSLLQGQQSEWALLKRHHTEDIFGIQICGTHPDVMTRCSQLLSETASFDFLDINLGCPLEMLYRQGAGCALMKRFKKLENIIHGITSVIDVPLTLKMRTGIHGGDNIAHTLIDRIHQWNDPISLLTMHGRSKEQRYTKSANWEYISYCNKMADPIPFFGNGDVLSFEDYNRYRKESKVAGAMIARGALIKPWIFTEIKEQRHWDISASERFEILKKFTNYGFEHWGSDTEGVEKTRRFLLEWLSFLYRYIPVGLLECPPQKINERPPQYFGRNDLETLMASPSCNDWIKISEMLLGPVSENFVFLPKHKANAYE